MAIPQNAVAVADAQGLETLGTLVTYSFSDEYTPAGTVIKRWAKHGLDPSYLPDVKSAAHVFMAACRSVETRRGQAGVEVKVDRVLENDREVIYQITHLVRDKDMKEIELPRAMTLALSKALETIDVRQLEDYDRLRGLEEAVRKHFEKHKSDLHGQKIRNAVREVIIDLGGQNLRRKAGGLYFVPETRHVLVNGRGKPEPTRPIIDGLGAFLEEMYGERADFYTIPLLASDAADKMVAKHFAINVGERTEKALETAINRVRQGHGTRNVRDELLTGLYNEQRAISGLLQQYDQLVTVEKDTIEKNLADLDKAVRDLEAMRDQFEAEKAKK